VPSDDLRSRDFRKILLIKLSAVGDVVHTFPVLNKLRRRYPAARLDWLVTPGIAELLQHNPAISNVIEFARDERSAPWRLAPFVAAARLVAQLRAVEYDLVIDLQGQLRSGFFAFTSGAPVRLGFDKPRAAIWKTLARKIPDEARKHAWQGAREGSWLAYTDRLALPTIDAFLASQKKIEQTILATDISALTAAANAALAEADNVRSSARALAAGPERRRARSLLTLSF